MIITIDGPSGVGKGTLSKHLAKHFNLHYLDTGKIYRTVALKCIEKGIHFNNINQVTTIAKSINHTMIFDNRLRYESIAQIASRIASHNSVRKALLKLQKNFCKPPFGKKIGVVLDGRDTGTVICPKAKYKFFLKADTELRAQRRFQELRCIQTNVIYKDVLDDLIRRDNQDYYRTVSPLMDSENTVTIDSSYLNAKQVFQKAIFFVKKKIVNT